MERDDLALNNELEALLTQATPSPQFKSGVLQRVDELEPSRAGNWLGVAAAMATAGLVIVTTVLWMRGPATNEATVAEPAAAAPAPPVALTPALAATLPEVPVANRSPRGSASSPEVIVAADEVTAFKAFVSIAQEGRVSADMFQAPADPSPAVIEPLRVEPLASIPPLKEPDL